MRKDDAFVGDRDDIVVERPGADRRRRLLDEQGAGGIEAVAARDRLARGAGLAGGKAAAVDAVDEDFDSRRIVARGDAHMVRRTFVAEAGDRRMDDECRVRKAQAQLRLGRRCLVAPVRHCA